MYRKLENWFTIFLILELLSLKSAAQEFQLENTLSDILDKGYPPSYVHGYMQPFTTAMGITVNGASFHTAKVSFFPKLEIGVNVVYISVPEDARYFMYDNERKPTFFGPDSPDVTADVPGSGILRYTIPHLQVNLGMFSYFQASVRATRYKIPEMGEINLLGFGVKYGLSDLLLTDFMGLEFSVQAFYHAYGIGSWLSSGTFAINIQSSARLPFAPVDIFSGLGYERVSLKVKTDRLSGIGNNAVGDILIDGKNGVRFTLGIGLEILIFNLYAEYNLGFYNSAGGGISMRF